MLLMEASEEICETSPWLAWAPFADDPKRMATLIAQSVLNRALSDHEAGLVATAAGEFRSPDRAQQSQTRAKIAYFLISRFKPAP